MLFINNADPRLEADAEEVEALTKLGLDSGAFRVVEFTGKKRGDKNYFGILPPRKTFNFDM